MIISFCIPIMNRLEDLKEAMPHHIAIADRYPPIQIAVADINSTDGLEDYMKHTMEAVNFNNGSYFTYRKYTQRSTWHMALGFNLAMKLGDGDYLVATPADHYVELGYIPAVMEFIEQGCVWITGPKFKDLIAIKREEFYNTGGYDEHFELYGPEDLDLQERLARRGGKYGQLPFGLVQNMFTPEDKKMANYRIKGNKKELSNLMLPHLNKNRQDNQLVANQDIEWGQW